MATIYRGFDRDLKFRFTFAETKDLVEEAHKTHGTSATATAALGRFLTQAVIVAEELKNPSDTITLTMDGGGIAGKLIAVANAKGEVKGYMTNPKADLPSTAKKKLDVGGIVGKSGNLTIIRDYGLKEPYTAVSPIVSGEIAEDFAYYYAMSEQVPTYLVLGVLVDTDLSVKSAGGLLIQAMPGLVDSDFYELEEAASQLPSLSHLLADLTPAEILDRYFAKLNFEIASESTAQYACDCSEEKVHRAIVSLGKDEIKRLIDEKEPVEVVCEFCKTKYPFSDDDMKKILEEAKA